MMIFQSAHHIMRVLIMLVALTLPALVEAAPFTVTNTDDSGAGSLRQAVMDAEASAGADEILFDGVTGTINLNSDLPELTESLTITGPGADVLTIDADGADHVFSIHSPTDDQDLVVSGLTLTGAVSSALKNRGVTEHLDTLTVDSCILTGNSASAGGAINPNGGTTTISNSTIFDNEAGNGGGIRVRMANQSVQVTISNTTISGNRARTDGGGIEVDIGTVILNNVTLIDNESDSDNDMDGDGGGFFMSMDTSLTLKNTIVAGNTDMGGEGPDCSGPGTIDSDGYNFVGDTTGCSLVAETGDQVDKLFDGTFMLTDVIDTTLADNGSPTTTHALVEGSPAIDAGNPASPGSGGVACEATDQRDFNRPADGDGDDTADCDIGAFELDAEPRCGDGFLDAGEECDDGNEVSGDGCSSTCEIEEGNGTGDSDGNGGCSLMPVR